MQQTDHDRITRQNALRYAIDNRSGAPAESIVSDAEMFHAFLCGTTTTATPTEGNTQTP